MKKFATLFILFTVLFSFSACGDDDDDNVEIYGTWKFEKMAIDKIKSNNSQYNALLKQAFSKLNENNISITMTFNQDLTYEGRVNGQIENIGSYTIQGSKITVISDDGEDLGIFYLKGSRLVMSETLSQADLEDEYDIEFSDDYIITELTLSTYFKK